MSGFSATTADGDLPIDLRSDAVTRPRPDMWQAMASDPLDWSRDGDATVVELESLVAELVDKPAALFVPSGTMANTLAATILADQGDSFLVDETAHILRAEGRSYERLARLEPHPVIGERGHPTASQVEDAVNRSGRVSLVWLENTHTFAGGTVSSFPEDQELAAVARRYGASIHLDGARLWNASVASGMPMAELASVADTVNLNLSKGLGAPAGSVLCGSPEVIESARDLTLALGGYVAQAGLLAAAGVASLQGFEVAIAADHELATRLAAGLRAAGLDADEPETNIVFVHVANAEEFRTQLAEVGVLAFVRDSSTIRFVTHREIEASDIDRVVALATGMSVTPVAQINERNS